MKSKCFQEKQTLLNKFANRTMDTSQVYLRPDTSRVYLSFLYGPHFIRPVHQNFGPNILPYGPHNWLIRAYYCLGAFEVMMNVSRLPCTIHKTTKDGNFLLDTNLYVNFLYFTLLPEIVKLITPLTDNVILMTLCAIFLHFQFNCSMAMSLTNFIVTFSN